ncbi:hypothetical protein [Vibrio phage BONAISHI]|nr:hypothetical protein [Vibrio phage BONAISHI]
MFKFLESKFKSFVKACGKAIRDARDWLFDVAAVRVFEVASKVLFNSNAIFIFYMACIVLPVSVATGLLMAIIEVTAPILVLPAALLMMFVTQNIFAYAVRTLLRDVPNLMARAYLKMLSKQFGKENVRAALKEAGLTMKFVMGIASLKEMRAAYYQLKEMLSAQEAPHPEFDCFLQLELAA